MMKGNGRRKVRYDELALIVLFAAIGIGMIFFGSYTVQRREIEAAERGFLTQNAVSVSMRYSVTGEEKNELASRLMRLVDGRNAALFTFDGHNAYGIIAGGKTAVPGIISGRYFQSGDFSSGERVCVMGESVYTTRKNGLIVRDGEEYYSSDGVLYKVIGVMGFSVYSQTSMTLLKGIDVSSYRIRGNISFILDADSVQTRQAVIDDMAQIVGADNVVTSEVPVQGFSVTKFFGMESLNLLMLMSAVVTVVISTIPLTLLWSQRRRKRVAVQRLIGFSTALATAQMFGRLLLLFHAGFVLCYPVYALISLFTDIQLAGFFSAEMLVAYAASLAVNLLISVVPFVQTMKVEPGDALRKA